MRRPPGLFAICRRCSTPASPRRWCRTLSDDSLRRLCRARAGCGVRTGCARRGESFPRRCAVAAGCGGRRACARSRQCRHSRAEPRLLGVGLRDHSACICPCGYPPARRARGRATPWPPHSRQREAGRICRRASLQTRSDCRWMKGRELFSWPVQCMQWPAAPPRPDKRPMRRPSSRSGKTAARSCGVKRHDVGAPPLFPAFHLATECGSRGTMAQDARQTGVSGHWPRRSSIEWGGRLRQQESGFRSESLAW